MTKFAQGFNTAAKDSNPSSLSRESEALHFTHAGGYFRRRGSLNLASRLIASGRLTQEPAMPTICIAAILLVGSQPHITKPNYDNHFAPTPFPVFSYALVCGYAFF